MSNLRAGTSRPDRQIERSSRDILHPSGHDARMANGCVRGSDRLSGPPPMLPTAPRHRRGRNRPLVPAHWRAPRVGTSPRGAYRASSEDREPPRPPPSRRDLGHLHERLVRPSSVARGCAPRAPAVRSNPRRRGERRARPAAVRDRAGAVRDRGVRRVGQRAPEVATWARRFRAGRRHDPRHGVGSVAAVPSRSAPPTAGAPFDRTTADRHRTRRRVGRPSRQHARCLTESAPQQPSAREPQVYDGNRLRRRDEHHVTDPVAGSACGRDRAHHQSADDPDHCRTPIVASSGDRTES